MPNASSTGSAPSRATRDRKSTRLNSSHSQISYAVFCLKKKNDHNLRNVGDDMLASRDNKQSQYSEGPRDRRAQVNTALPGHYGTAKRTDTFLRTSEVGR